MTRTLALAAAVLLLLAACTGDGTEEAVDPPPTVVALPSASATPLPPPSASPSVASAPPTVEPTVSPAEGEDVAVQVYFLRDQASGLWLEPVPVTVTGPGVAAGALSALAGGGDVPAGLSAVLPEGTTVNSVNIDPDGLLTVDLTLGAGGLGASYEATAIQAIALTATQFDTVTAVQILVDGQVTETLSGHVEITEPIEPDPFAISPILIDQVSGIAGSGVGGGSIELSGTSNVFEAVFSLDLLDARGNVIESAPTMATCGSGCRGAWTAAFSDLEPGAYTVVAREEDASDGEGRPVFEVSVPVEVP